MCFSQMAGGPCPNPNGQCSLNISAKCTGNTSKIWYGKAGSKYCKSCYGAKSKQDKAGGSGARDLALRADRVGCGCEERRRARTRAERF